MFWKKASGPVGNCYKIARPEEDIILLGDSKLDDQGVPEDQQPVIPFTLAGWMDVVMAVRRYEMSLGEHSMMLHDALTLAQVVVVREEPDKFVWRSLTDEEIELSFSCAEHDALISAIYNLDFVPEESGGDLTVEGGSVAEIV